MCTSEYTALMFNLRQLAEIGQPPPVAAGACYQDLGVDIAPDMLSYISQTVDQHADPTTWSRDDNRTFWQLHLPDEQLAGLDPLLDQLSRDFTMPHITLLYMQPWTSVVPHQDQFRFCGINAVLTDSPSTTYWLTGVRRPEQNHIIELEPPRFRYHAFNTRITHGVVNRSLPRLVLTMDLGPPAGFDDVVRWFHTRSL
jgi:hypothetical protein